MIPKEELSPTLRLNFAPMVDFLFITLTVFAVLAVTRSSLFETEIALSSVTQKEGNTQNSSHAIAVSVNKEGEYHLLTPSGEYPIDDLDLLKKELILQHTAGNLPANKDETHILLHIDKGAKWEQVSDMIISMKEVGFSAYPVYESR